MPVRHTVKQGECLSRIAKAYGFSDYKKLYDHPENADFKKKRPNPNVIYPGDVVFVPDRDKKAEQVTGGQKHRFQVQSSLKELRVYIKDARMKAISNVGYALEIDGNTRTGKTDGSGLLKERISTNATVASLTIAGRTVELRLSHLNPPNMEGDVSGVQSRLKALGYETGPVDGILGRRTRTAIAVFQSDYGLPVDGKATADTLRKLEEVFGC